MNRSLAEVQPLRWLPNRVPKRDKPGESSAMKSAESLLKIKDLGRREAIFLLDPARNTEA